MKTIIKYIILTASRDLLFYGLLIAIVAGIFISNFLGSTALEEQAQMAVSYSSASIRLILVVGMTIFCCFHIRRGFENKEIDLMLSRPISRGMFVLSYWIGFCIIALSFIAAAFCFILLFQNYSIFGAIIWVLSLILEVFLVISFAIFASFILKSAVSSVLLTFGFYFISRMLGFFLYILAKPTATDFLSLDFYANKILWFVSSILPRLDLFAKSQWLIYGVESYNDIKLFALQAAIYIPLLLFSAVYDFRNKQF
jgi:ABC-type transport system involved in multi-copper enzyme maturation permease subunit